MDFEQYLAKAMELASETIDKYGQQAWDTTLNIVFISAMQDLILGLVFLTISIGSGVVWFRKKKTWEAWALKKTENNRTSYTWDEHGDSFGWTLCCALISLFGAVISSMVFFNIWFWVQLFNPELYLAMKALSKIL